MGCLPRARTLCEFQVSPPEIFSNVRVWVGGPASMRTPKCPSLPCFVPSVPIGFAIPCLWHCPAPPARKYQRSYSLCFYGAAPPVSVAKQLLEFPVAKRNLGRRSGVPASHADQCQPPPRPSILTPPPLLSTTLLLTPYVSCCKEQKGAWAPGDPVVLTGMVDCASAITHSEADSDDLADLMILGLRTGQLLAYPMVPDYAIRPCLMNNLHSGTISKIIHSHFLGGVLTSSWDMSLKILSLQTNTVQRVLAGGRSGGGHQKAIFSFDWSEDIKLIASCGPHLCSLTSALPLCACACGCSLPRASARGCECTGLLTGRLILYPGGGGGLSEATKKFVSWFMGVAHSMRYGGFWLLQLAV